MSPPLRFAAFLAFALFGTSALRAARVEVYLTVADRFADPLHAAEPAGSIAH